MDFEEFRFRSKWQFYDRSRRGRNIFNKEYPILRINELNSRINSSRTSSIIFPLRLRSYFERLLSFRESVCVCVLFFFSCCFLITLNLHFKHMLPFSLLLLSPHLFCTHTHTQSLSLSLSYTYTFCHNYCIIRSFFSLLATALCFVYLASSTFVNFVVAWASAVV